VFLRTEEKKRERPKEPKDSAPPTPVLSKPPSQAPAASEEPMIEPESMIVAPSTGDDSRSLVEQPEEASAAARDESIQEQEQLIIKVRQFGLHLLHTLMDSSSIRMILQMAGTPPLKTRLTNLSWIRRTTRKQRILLEKNSLRQMRTWW
jgi:hypothetical protein